MSEFQYYEFQAVDRSLSDADRKHLRSISSRAEITSRSLTNTYEWGDFKGDPVTLMERCFDLHLYWANWGRHRLMLRLPARLLDRALMGYCMGEDGVVKLHDAGANVILDIWNDNEGGSEHWDPDWYEDGVVLQALAPLREALLGGDMRLYYLVWLLGVTVDMFEGDDTEPLPELGPLDDAVLAFGRFFEVDADLMQAAAERPARQALVVPPDAGRRYVGSLTGAEQSALLLLRVPDGDPLVAVDLQAGLRATLAAVSAPPQVRRRTVAELEVRAGEARAERERQAQAAALAAEQHRVKAAEEARRARMATLAKRGEAVWAEIEQEIGRRNAGGYDRAATLLTDLQALAQKTGTTAAYSRRLEDIRGRHLAKKRFLERIGRLD